MKNIYKLFLILLILINFNSLNVLAQANTNIMFINNYYRIIDIDSEFFIGSETIYDNGIIYVNWSIVNDSTPGTYIVFKSYNFNEFIPVGFVTYDIPFAIDKITKLTVIDEKYSRDYNFYHIVKIINNQPSFDYDMIKYEALNNISIFAGEKNDFDSVKSGVAFKNE